MFSWQRAFFFQLNGEKAGMSLCQGVSGDIENGLRPYIHYGFILFCGMCGQTFWLIWLKLI